MNDQINQYETFNGMVIIVSDYIRPEPVIEISKDFNACSDQCIQSINAWLLDMFGTYMPSYTIGNSLVVSREQYAAIKRAAGG